MKPVVSVVTIFFNAKPFLEEAISSVLRQSYDSWELLLVDDGSSDGSTQLAQSYAERHPVRIRYLSHDGKANRGMSSSRNLGLRHANGRYLIMLDADDTLAPEALERQTRILEDHPEVGMAYGATEWWYSWSTPSEDSQADFLKQLGFTPDTVIEPPALLEKMLKNEAHKPCGGMLRKDLVERLGGYEERFRGMYEDQAFIAKVALVSRMFVSSESWYRYRKHPDSCCLVAVREGTYRKSRIEFLQWLDGYLVQQGSTDVTRLRKTVGSEIWKARHPRLQRLRKKAQKWVSRTPGGSRTVARIRSLAKKQPFDPPVGKVAFGDLGRLEPFSRKWGSERGKPIDRVYIEKFLAEHSADIAGHVLEIGGDAYIKRFGGQRVTTGDVLDVKPGAGVTIVGDLSDPAHLPRNRFDCIVVTQTLQYISDVRSAVCHLRDMLKPGGVLLATVPGISPIPQRDRMPWGKDWTWLFTVPSLTSLLSEFFPAAGLSVRSRGNVLTAAAFLYGLSAEDLQTRDFDVDDGDFQMLLTIRAVRESQ